MRSWALMGGLLGVVLGASGCATMQSPAGGLLVTATQGPVSASGGPAGNRVGEACASSILGLVAIGDASIDTARRNGGIAEVTSVDRSYLQILFFYGRSCTIVRGR